MNKDLGLKCLFISSSDTMSISLKVGICYGLNICIPQNSHVKALNPNI